MKNILVLFLIIIVNGSATAQQRQLDLTKSSIKWTGKNAVTGQKLSGTLKFKSGNINLQDQSIISAELVVDMLSLTAENEELQGHLRAEDFFDVDQFKTATFKLLEQAQIKEGSFEMKGTMTILNKSNEVSAKLQYMALENASSIKGSMTIDRTIFGIYHNSESFFTRMKEKAISKDFEIELQLFFQ